MILMQKIFQKCWISRYVSSQNCMKLRIISLHDLCKHCRKSISAKNIKDWVELISAPTILPRDIYHRHFGTVEISACVPFGPRPRNLAPGTFWHGHISCIQHYQEKVLPRCATACNCRQKSQPMNWLFLISVISNKGKHCWPFSMETKESFSTKILTMWTFWHKDVAVQKYFSTMII